MTPLKLYTLFHLNLAYSSLEEADRPEVVRRCYWPLLELADELGFPMGVELTGYTLEQAEAIDAAWVARLRRLIEAGTCELVGSGYAQVIGPLVPAEVTAANLRLGHDVYERLLGVRPALALVNEQAYSGGLVGLYREAGYRGIMMEWDNPSSGHPDWDPEWSYLPQRAAGADGAEIPLIWNRSIAFQKFQRYAHGELELGEYLDYLRHQVGDGPRAFPLYGNDVEVFEYRPGRYETEPELVEGVEWGRVREVMRALQADQRFDAVLPGAVLDLIDTPAAGRPLRLESAAQPVPVKKQGKYNITRWAVTGRDDLTVNTACWRIYDALRERSDATDDHWRELCYLWSSDFRTHIAPERWAAFRRRLAEFEDLSGARSRRRSPVRVAEPSPPPPELPAGVTAEREGRYLTVRTPATTVRLNCRRGLAVDALWLGAGESDPPLCGTLHHGYYEDIMLGADFYTGHMVLESADGRVTDLNPTEPRIRFDEATGAVTVEARVPTELGTVHKRVSVDPRSPRLRIEYGCDWPSVPAGSLRLGNITVNPEAFERDTLKYRVRNGGRADESFPLTGQRVDHGRSVSFLVSANHGVGVTDGPFVFEDGRRVLTIEVDKCAAALIGLVTYRETAGSYFCRLALSAGEMDETRRPPEIGLQEPLTCGITLATGPYRRPDSALRVVT